MTLYRKKKIEIVVDKSLQEEVAELVLRCGATGYTLIPEVSGQGSRGMRDSGDIFGVFGNAMFIVVVAPQIAERIVKETMALLEDQARMVLVSDVDVVRDDHF